ncbi:hypothetical protein CMV_006586 [Castanea mollissima]|uniref:Aminotransferase class I/classII large domain-containing protein n=1 Tax=Castanea mollissima TaxID=60419 RepID=A0A8J4RVD3_9ROSI|nr:hypothetical protein CMV_006586 [Castanea mollissima]
MDLRRLLKEQTLESEMNLWRLIMNEVKLNVSPGSSFHCSEPGWFRVCFANMDDDTVEVALERIRVFVEKQQVKSKRKFQNNLNLKLSCTPRRYDESVMSPHMMSPRSPLVRART